MQRSLAIAFTTIGRPHIAMRFVEAARLCFANIPIYVADQSKDDAAIPEFYERHGVHQIRMDYDAGLSASRNRLMSEIAEDYVWLCDDDYLFYGGSRFDEAVAILDAHPEVAVVGGRVFDIGGDILRKWHWENFLYHDQRNRLLLVLPIYQTAPILRRTGDTRFYLCDAVHNFAIFRRAIFNDIIKWDERFKINGEHEDFYLTLKRNSSYRAAYLPTMVGFHRPEVVVGNYQDLRTRTEFWRYFRRKWNIDQYVEIGTGLWLIDDAYDHLSAEEVADRFYADVDGPLRHDLPTRTQAATAEPRTRHAAGGAYLTSEATAGDRPASDSPELFDPDKWRISCRYDVGHRNGAPLILWWTAEPEERSAGDGCPVLELRARWFAADGRVLVWETNRVSVPLSAPGEWLPAWFEVPLLPRNGGFLRFEIIAESTSGLLPLCCGFLRPETDQQEAGPAAADVLALGIPREPTALLDLPTTDPPFTLCAERLGPTGSGLQLLRLDRSSEIAALWFKDWPRTGYSLLGVRLPSAAVESPFALAIPDVALSVSTAEIRVSDCRGRLAPAIIRNAGEIEPRDRAAVARRPRATAQDGVAVVLTSCGRQDLLERTLDSFFAVNTAPIAQFIVMEDGATDANSSLIERYRQHRITWLDTGRRVGQIAAIDHAYAQVEHPYIFHMEDDWEFYRGGFIENSLQVLEAFPDCLQVWLRALDDTNEHPLSAEQYTAGGVPFRRLQFGFGRVWHGFSFNPGLRRTADYRLLGKYGWFVTFDPRNPARSEWVVSEIYRQLGFYAAILADLGGIGYVKHLGWGRTIGDPVATDVDHA